MELKLLISTYVLRPGLDIKITLSSSKLFYLNKDKLWKYAAEV